MMPTFWNRSPVRRSQTATTTTSTDGDDDYRFMCDVYTLCPRPHAEHPLRVCELPGGPLINVVVRLSLSEKPKRHEVRLLVGAVSSGALSAGAVSRRRRSEPRRPRLFPMLIHTHVKRQLINSFDKTAVRKTATI